jgi:hypothetical protein
MTTKIKAGVIEAGAISTASLADTSITAAKLAGTLDLTGKTVTVATATAGDNDTTVASTAFVSTAIANLTDSAPAALDTLNELAAALNDDANFSTTVTNSIATKLPLAGGTLTGDLNFGDSDKAVFGAGSDLQIYHDGSNSYIDETAAGNLFIRAHDRLYLQNYATGENHLIAIANDAVKLYYDNAEKLATTSTGIDVTGTATMDGLDSSGTAFIRGASAGRINLDDSGVADGSQPFKFLSSDGGSLIFGTANRSGTSTTSSTEIARFDSSGNLLVGGTTTPDTNGISIETSASSGGLSIISPTTGRGDIFFGDTADLNIGQIRYAHSDNSMTFRTNAADRVVIDSSGNVGIGTSSPSKKLDIVSSTAGDGIRIGNTNSGTDHARLSFVSSNGTSIAAASSELGRVDFCSRQSDGSDGIRASIYAVNPVASAYWAPPSDIVFSTSTLNVADVTERMRIDSSGNVGIGIAAPTSQLHLHKAAGTAYLKQTNTANGQTLEIGNAYSLYTGANGAHSAIASDQVLAFATADAERMRIASNGNVGIGTTSPAQKLSVSGASGSARLSIERSNANTTGGVGSIQWNALDGHAVAGVAALGDGNDEGAHLIFSTTSAASSSDLYASASERLRIDSSGNVGIGTTSPSSPLEVVSGASLGTGFNVSRSGHPTFSIISGGTDSIYFSLAPDGGSYQTFMQVRDDDTDVNSIAFSTSGSERLRIDSSGNVGIGTTSPSKGLHLNFSNDYAAIRFQNTANAKVWDLTPSIPDVANSGFSLYNVTDNTIALHVDNSNNVGIGTSSPAGLLDVNNTSNSHQVAIFRQNNASYNTDIALYHTSSSSDNTLITKRSNGDLWLYQSTAKNIAFYTNNAERMRIDSSGNLLVNTTSQYGSQKLSVNGGIAIDGRSAVTPGLCEKSDTDTGIFWPTTNTLGFSTAGAERMRIDSSGRVGIGTTSPTAGTSLDVQGNYIRCKNVYMGTGSGGSKFEGGNGSYEPGTGNLLTGSYGLNLNFLVAVTGVGVSTSARVDSPTGDFYTNDGTISSLSDERVKGDITTLSDGLEIVKQLRPVTFKYTDTSEDAEGNKRMGGSNDKTRYGFIAQEVEAVAPQYVETGIGYVNNVEVSDFKSLSTTRMIPMLLKSIQEQQTIIESLKARITALES